MTVAVLIVWLATAAAGGILLAGWLVHGGVGRAATPQADPSAPAPQTRPAASRLPHALIFGHPTLAVVGLLVWISYPVADEDALAWVAFVVIVPAALLGWVMFGRWVASGGPRHEERVDGTPPENHLPVSVVAVHGLLAVTTVVLVLLAALGVGT